MERSRIGRSLLAALVASTAVLAGCDQPCKSARERIDLRYLECDVETLNPAPATNENCTAEEAEYQRCLADCTESASCDALKQKDPVATEDFAECIDSCGP